VGDGLAARVGQASGDVVGWLLVAGWLIELVFESPIPYRFYHILTVIRHKLAALFTTIERLVERN
jgi:hypothetical protein